MKLNNEHRVKLDLLTHIEPNTGCWLWAGASDKDGYPQVTINRYPYRVHRIRFIDKWGEIPKGLILRHKCNTANCSNPEHLILGTQADNIKDMIRSNRAAWQTEYAKNYSFNKDECKNGHSYAEYGFYLLKNKWRICKKCHLDDLRKRNKTKKELEGYKGNHKARMTHCKNGHEYTPENTILKTYKGNKKCRLCRACKIIWENNSKCKA